MITPAYALTATERIVPRLALNFTTASLDARVTVSRALNTATRINSSGYVEVVNANLPRFDFNLNTGGTCRGLLIEETRTNILRNWSDFTQVQWVSSKVNGATAPTNTGSTTLAPDNVSNAQIWQFIAPVSGDRSVLAQTVSGLTTGFWAASMFMKAGRAEDVGKIISIKETQGGPYTLVTLTNQWQRPESINTSVATTHGMAVELRPAVGTSTGTVQVAIWGAQTEAGSFVTSAIPNATIGNVTRNADVVTMTGTNFSNWWQATTGGAAVRARQLSVSGTAPWLQFDDTTTNNFITLRGNTTNPELYIKATTDQAQIDAGTIAANTNYGLAGAWNTDNCAAAINGNAAVTDTSATIPTVTQARLGSDGTNYLNGWLQYIQYWPQRITNAETQAFSKL